MLGQLVRIFSLSILLNTALFSASDLSPKYLRLFTDGNGKGVWQMVGVAGFYNNIYGVEYENSQSKYTSFYCENNSETSIIRTRVSVLDPINDMQGEYWLFSVKVDNDLGDLSPLIVDVQLSDINCTEVVKFANGNTALVKSAFISKSNLLDQSIKFQYPDSGNNNSIVFSLGYKNPKMFDFDLTQASNNTTLTLEFNSSIIKEINITDERYSKINTVTQPVSEIVDLYLNDNPGFGINGSGENNYSNSDRNSREYHSANHQIPINTSNYISERSELTIWSFDSSNGQWQEYNSKNTDKNSNEFTNLQAGKGYWMKYNTSFNSNNVFLQTLDLNPSCGSGCESNLTIISSTANRLNYNFTNSDVTNIVKYLTDTNISNGEVNISAIKIANNSVLIIAEASAQPKLQENTVGNDVFLNISTATHSFWSSHDIKSGLVLGDSNNVLNRDQAYNNIATKGWNLLTLPTASIRKTVTGLIVDWANYDTFSISDEFGINVIDMGLVNIVNSTDANVSARNINKNIEKAKISGQLSSEFFNIRAFPIVNNTKILFISDDKFVLHTTGTFGTITNLQGKDVDLKNNKIVSTDKKTASSNYGEYAIMIQPNLSSAFVDGSYATMKINNIEIILKNTLSGIVGDISVDNIKAYTVDADLNGSMAEDGSDFILLASNSPISVKDTTYTRVYSYSKNSQGSDIVNIFTGTDIDSKLDSVSIPKDTNITTANKISSFTITDKKVKSYVIGKDSNTEYIIISSTKDSSINLQESVAEQNITEDSLKTILNYEENITSKGSLLSGIQGNDLAKFDINLTTGTITLTPKIKNITTNSFVSEDLLFSNALISLSNTITNNAGKLIPTMIIGSESNILTNKIYWKTLSPIQNIDKWYDNYNLFSTNNQKAYWVYLDSLSEDNESLKLFDSNVTVEKSYLRTFDNELNTTTNVYNISNIKVNSNNYRYGNQDIYIVANLIGVSSELEKIDFILDPDSAPQDKTFSTSISSFNVDGLDNNLTQIKITATDGRIYTYETTVSIDVKKPKKPIVSFIKDGNDVSESVKLFIKSGDFGTEADDTVKYRIYKSRINETEEYVSNPPNLILEVDTTLAEEGIDSICKDSKFAGNNLDFVELIIVGLDDNKTTQANFSDMTKINFLPLQGVHYLVNDANNSNKTDKPNYYDADCVNHTDSLESSGIGVRSLTVGNIIKLAYQPLDTTTSTAIPFNIFVSIPSNATKSIAKVYYKEQYVGKNFFIYYNGKIYKGPFLDEATHNEYDNDEKPYLLTLVSESGQQIGE